MLTIADPPTTTKPVTHREQREAKKAEMAALKAKKAEHEDAVFKDLKDRKPKVKSRKACAKVCKDDFKIGLQGAKRIWDRLCGKKPVRPKPRKSTSKRQIRKP